MKETRSKSGARSRTKAGIVLSMTCICEGYLSYHTNKEPGLERSEMTRRAIAVRGLSEVLVFQLVDDLVSHYCQDPL